MKKIFIAVLTVLTYVITNAQSPNLISYQAVVRDATNNLLSNQGVGVQISVLKNAISGSVMYSESYSITTNENGLLTIDIGAGNITTGSLNSIEWGDGTYYIKTEIDPANLGGTNYSITSVAQLLSVPYALYANTTDSLIGVNKEDIASKMELDDLRMALENYQISKGDLVIDIDGNTYRLVTIGSQTWMKENLKATRYSDGTPIPGITNGGEWANLSGTDRAYTYPNNDSLLVKQFGLLYTYTAAVNGDYSGNEVQGACPTGFHVPSDTEFKVLEQFLGMTPSEANKYGVWRGTDEGSKIAGTTLWNNGSLKTNGSFGKSGFDAVPAGYISMEGSVKLVGRSSYMWTSTLFNNSPLTRLIESQRVNTYRYITSESNRGISLRCIKN